MREVMKKIKKTILLMENISLDRLTQEAVNELFNSADKQEYQNIRFQKYYDKWYDGDIISIVGDHLETDDELEYRRLTFEKAKEDAKKKEAKQLAKERKTYEWLERK